MSCSCFMVFVMEIISSFHFLLVIIASFDHEFSRVITIPCRAFASVESFSTTGRSIADLSTTQLATDLASVVRQYSVFYAKKSVYACLD